MSRKSHCSNDTPVPARLLSFDMARLHVQSHALAHGLMEPLVFFIFAEKYRCEDGWSTSPRFISFPLRAFWSMIL